MFLLLNFLPSIGQAATSTDSIYEKCAITIKSNENLLEKVFFYDSLAVTNHEKKNFSEALKFRKLCNKIKDSIFVLESKEQLSEMQRKYETAKKESEIKILNRNSQLNAISIQQKGEEVKRQQILIFSFVLGFLVILAFFIVLYRLFLAKKKANLKLRVQNEEIRQQKEEIEAQRDEIGLQRDLIARHRDIAADQRDEIGLQKQEIMDSIQYAKRIQTAVLPTEEYVTKNLPEHFVFYRPKDVISGDFYWVKQVFFHGSSEKPLEHITDTPLSSAYFPSPKPDLLIIAVADCTGHGVPGAFMSMLGIALLNEIITAEHLLSSDEILNKLRKKVIVSLHQRIQSENPSVSDSEAVSIKDGMDMTLVVLDLANNIVQFSGANNPLWVIPHERNGIAGQAHNDGVITDLNDGVIVEVPVLNLVEVKGDKMPVGIYHSSDLEPFTKHTLQLEKGDQIYLFSDGFPDQFGGPPKKGGKISAGRKFKHKPFKELILNNSNKTCEDQKLALSTVLEEWMSYLNPYSGLPFEQVDDITVLGMRL